MSFTWIVIEKSKVQEVICISLKVKKEIWCALAYSKLKRYTDLLTTQSNIQRKKKENF